MSDEPGWLYRQIELAQQEYERWPDWLKEARERLIGKAPTPPKAEEER